jgi:hypothetical protein
MNKGKRKVRSAIGEMFVVVIMLCIPGLAAPKEVPLPDKVISAKSIYLDNQTGDQAVLDTATDEFTKWGRFAIAKSKDDADLDVVFTHKFGMDKWGNVSSIEMNIFVNGRSEPAFKAKSALKLITAPQHRTKACIADFKKHLERKV